MLSNCQSRVASVAAALLFVVLVRPAAAAPSSFQWGLPGDVPISADFDGDGTPDLTVFRPSTGTWYLRLSSQGYALERAIRYQFGLAGDVPMAADYDHDGLTDVAVFRPSTGTWHVTYSGSRPQITDGFGPDARITGSSAAFTVFTGRSESRGGTIRLPAPMRCVASVGPEGTVSVGVRMEGARVEVYTDSKSGFLAFSQLTVLCQ